jgi:TolB-like protein/Tfp pilus assembly protein PilF
MAVVALKARTSETSEPPHHSAGAEGRDRLDSWKEIAVYLKRGVRTAQRWEREERLPVHRHLHDKQGTVYAYASELEVWRNARGQHRPIDSLAVLPFANESSDATLEYLGDGIAESLIHSLSRLPRLRVLARSTVFRFRKRANDPRKVGRALQVGAVLAGRVVLQEDHLMIGVELVEVATGRALWGQQYRRRPGDILRVQEEIAGAIFDALRLRLTSAERTRLTRRSTQSSEAYQLYLKGRFCWNKRTREGLTKGIDYFEQAAEKDTEYTLAYVGLADSYNLLPYYAVMPARDAIPRAKQAARTALEIDDQLAEAHSALAFATWIYDLDWPAAEKGMRRAIELEPTSAIAHNTYGIYLTACGRAEEAIAEMKRAQELEPASSIINATTAWVFYLLRLYDKAIEQAQTMLELDPGFPVAHRYLGLAYEQKRMFPQALEELQRAATLSGGSAENIASLAHAYTMANSGADARKLLHELTQRSAREYVPSYEVAVIYAGLGEKEPAFDWLEKTFEERYHWLNLMGSDPRLAPLRSDARFDDLLRRVGHPTVTHQSEQSRGSQSIAAVRATRRGSRTAR